MNVLTSPLSGWVFSLGLMCLSLGLGFCQTSARALVQSQQVLHPDLDNHFVSVTGRITSLPDRTNSGWRFRFEPLQADDLPSAIWVSWTVAYGSSQATPEIKADQCWQLPLRLRRPYGEMNPHGFDTERWFWERGLGASALVVQSRASSLELASHNCEQRWSMLSYRQRLRDAIEQTLGQTPQAGVIAALTLGDQASIDRSDWDLFRVTGVAHLMAISGVHITALAWLCATCVGWCWARARWGRRSLALMAPAPWVGGVAGCACAFVYACFAGFELPAQRTVWMLGMFVGLRFFSKQWPWHQVWCLVAWWVVMCDPFAMLQAGFWLSFVAVAILFSAGDTPSNIQASQTHRLKSIVQAMGKEQWLMSVCLAPLSLVLFAQISLVGLLANLIAVPWVTFVITPLSMLGVGFPKLWHLAGVALQWLTQGLIWMSQWPWAYWQISVAPTLWSALGLMAMAVWALRVPLWVKAMAFMWVLPMVSWAPTSVPHGEFEMWAADVGQGQAVIIRTHSSVILFDSGPTHGHTDAAERTLIPLFTRMGWRPDAVIVSHVDADHSGGVLSLMRAYPDLQWMGSLPAHQALTQRDDFLVCESGLTWQIDGVEFDVLHPQPQTLAANTPTNATSCVVRVRSATQRTALLTGDIGVAQERALLAQAADWATDWLQVPHHGSTSSSSAEFVTATQPRFAVIQVGYFNRFGHPRVEILTRYKEVGSEVVQTPQCGASRWASWLPGEMHCERTVQKRFWHHAF
jgi:competence protein ComEC